MVVPFNLANNLIVVEAEIEGQKGNFFVDNGSPSFILNSKRFEKLYNKSLQNNKPVYGAGGAIQDIREVKAGNFIWQDLKLKSVNALINDLSHLEKSTGVEIHGIIGVDLLKKFVLLFDYDSKRLTLFSGVEDNFWNTSPGKTIDFEMVGHIPVINTKIDSFSMRFGIDCGAAGAMIFTNI